MGSLLVILRLANWVMNQVARKLKSYEFHWCDLSSKTLHQPSLFPSIAKCDLEGRGYEMKLRVMIFISFCGLRMKDMENTARAVLPKFYLENLSLKAYEVVASVGSRVFFTTMPRVMVAGFLKDYLNADAVIATELHTSGSYFTGLLSKSGLLVKHGALMDYFGETKPDLGICNTSLHDQLFISLCKEAYVVINEEARVMPRNKYPKPLIFHDGRLAFLPTPSATLIMFMWLPIGFLMAIYRIFLGVFLSSKLTILALGTWSGIYLNFNDKNQQRSELNKGVLYVCSHRTLLDPVFLSTCLGRRLTAVTYSLSKVSELIAPIRTMRLTRDRSKDGDTMKRLLCEGDLVVFPEGTTCREPYLLRFSSLFAELADEIVPVDVNVHVSMFYGTTASGLKFLDPIFFFMNPWPTYDVQIIGKVPRELTCAGGKCSHEVANYIQRQLAETLGFECTNLTRRDKYMMLAGNEGVLQQKMGKRFC
ncbi:hypothetical protein VNO78_27499 [Psophocarpus tetragonolobus]|uniref:Phospholipid/glycerol acyltransferase domain-containing protein n=1 Tax=Psophocarpus tetragonolobus TaxID=3891 RepID=A0AAN9XBD2_PSOTE